MWRLYAVLITVRSKEVRFERTNRASVEVVLNVLVLAMENTLRKERKDFTPFFVDRNGAQSEHP
jgi:hypothetical protein